MKHFNKKIDPILHLAFLNLTGKKEPRIIPGPIMWNEIIPFFNDMNIRIGYSDKNIYDKLINPSSSADTILKRVRGHYFDHNNNLLTTEKAYNVLVDYGNDVIIKPSDNDNGRGIAKLFYNNTHFTLEDKKITMSDLEEIYGFNYVIQKVIEQHAIMAAPHPSSVNTLRMVTFRWKNEIKYLFAFARFGVDHDVKDNAATGGVSVGVKDNGKFMNFAIDKNRKIHTHHPTTQFDFSKLDPIPNYDRFKQYIIDLHRDILHHDYVSWDIAVGLEGQPIFIETNYRGSSWLNQLALQRPIFGDLTEEVLQHVRSGLDNYRFKRNVKSIVPSLKSDNRKMKSEIKSLNKENKNLKASLSILEQRLKKAEKEINNLENSTSWRVTKPLRGLGQLFKK